jgi:2-oxoisovalerate dehydrogenase E2 component (dihydrolipoyl transacylase)
MSDTLVRMPKLADTLVEGTLGAWLKRAGEAVRSGEPLASIETDKVTTELTSPASGTLLELLVAEGQTVPIETPIARIGEPSAASAPSPRTDSPAVEPAPAAAPRKVTPVAARLLAEHSLNADDVASPSGRLTKDDVLAFVARRSPAPAQQRPAAAVRPEPPPPREQPPPTRHPTTHPSSELVPLSPMRRAIAEHMLKAHQAIPHGQTVVAADLTRLVAWRDVHRQKFEQREGANPTFTVFFVYALARQLAAHFGSSVDVGVAVALDAGLIVPVLRRADSLSLGETARGVADLAVRARAGKLAPDETHGGRMTLTNVGSFGNLTASPIVPLGQIGILGTGLVERRPFPTADGGIRPGWRCLLSLTCDRRAFDDFAADRFLLGFADELSAIPG